MFHRDAGMEPVDEFPLRRFSAPDALQGIQRALQDASAIQAAKARRREGRRRLHANPRRLPAQHAAVAQTLERQHQLVARKAPYFPQVCFNVLPFSNSAAV